MGESIDPFTPSSKLEKYLLEGKSILSEKGKLG